MAVMSFAHMRPSKNIVTGIAATSPQESVVDEKKAGSAAVPGVMSFAYLRPGGKQVKQVMPAKVEVVAKEVQVEASTEVTFPSTHHTTYRIPVTLPTARLSSTNYCRGCGRFMPASPWEKTVGVPYGRCRRDDEVIDGGDVGGTESVVRRVVEVWKIIPSGATVAMCWYWVKEIQKEKQ